MSKKIFLIGGSSGIGLELVKLFLKKDYYVVSTSRNITKSQELRQISKTNNKLALYDIDTSSNKNIDKTILQIWNEFNGIDICFYNAGIYDSMNIHNIDLKKFEDMININYIGFVRILKHLTPYFINSKKGHFIVNSSISSYFGLPNGGAYSASKAALLNLAQSLYPELNLLNIKLQIINHGFVKTRLTNKNDFYMPQLMSTKKAALTIIKKLESNDKNFEITFPYILSIFLKLLNILPYKISLFITKKLLK
jgi:short-subunit dehydrogenase